MRRSVFVFATTLILLWLVGYVHPPALDAANEAQVDITIRDYKYEVHAGVIHPDMPVTILIRNRDKVEHGFTSPVLEEFNAQVETGGVTTFGKGIKGIHILPGGEARIHFVPTRSGEFRFQCDIHPTMKGELLMLSVGVG
jgi:hypothetical protein